MTFSDARRMGPLLLLLLLVTSLAAQPPSARRARITYLAGGMAYLDAGREDGLREGQVLEVRREGQSLAKLTVTYLASHRAACTIGEGSAQIAVGDSVEFVPSAPPPAAADSTRSVPRPDSRKREGVVHGRIGLRYLRIQPPIGAGYNQPALDLRLDGSRLGGSPVGVVMDLRVRRTYRRLNDTTRSVEARNALYQAAVLYRPAGPARVTLGRQYLPTVSSVTLFDGALVEYQQARFGAGIFAGAEPEPVSMGIGDTRDLGFFLETRSAPRRPVRWSIAAGAVGSYTEGEVNREFGFLQASVIGPRVTFFTAQEIDLNRGWKLDAGEPQVSLTSTYASLTARPASWISLLAGVDSRRNVRLYRDYETPELGFDDSFRRGVWAGAAFAAAGHLRFGVDGRAGFGADTLRRTRSGTGWLALDRISPLRLSLRTRHTRYSSAGREGWLHSGGLTVRPTPWLGLDGLGGLRRETSVAGSGRAAWIGADVDLSLGRSLYLFGSWSKESGDLAAGDQLLASLSWRF